MGDEHHTFDEPAEEEPLEPLLRGLGLDDYGSWEWLQPDYGTSVSVNGPGYHFTLVNNLVSAGQVKEFTFKYSKSNGSYHDLMVLGTKSTFLRHMVDSMPSDLPGSVSHPNMMDGGDRWTFNSRLHDTGTTLKIKVDCENWVVSFSRGDTSENIYTLPQESAPFVVGLDTYGANAKFEILYDELPTKSAAKLE
eukprot:m.491048 g.491048  ORF g.491048 m.491048 type:complete len:193 (-) comp29089_c0_seq1:36-614(-)